MCKVLDRFRKLCVISKHYVYCPYHSGNIHWGRNIKMHSDSCVKPIVDTTNVCFFWRSRKRNRHTRTHTEQDSSSCSMYILEPGALRWESLPLLLVVYTVSLSSPPLPSPLIIMLSDVTWKNLPTGASELASNDAALGAQPSDQSSK